MNKNKYFKQNKEGELKEINLRDLIAEAMENSEPFTERFNIDVDSYEDDSGSWIEITKDELDNRIAIVLMFSNDGHIIDNLAVYKTPIKQVIQSDKTKQII